jgi:UDP-N-acetylglucosamine 2-epimerase (non-hydrolysing)
MQKKFKFLIIVGARPNFIKIAPLMKEFRKYRQIKPILVHTGQHYDFEMSKIFFQNLNIPKPNYNLGVGSGSHGYQTAEIMKKLEPILLKEKPNLVMVLGDVNSTLAGALTAAKINIPVAHIEAGMRSYNLRIPEEINRLLTDHLSFLLFCSTKTAVNNLKKEGIRKGIYNVGDIMYDALLDNIKIAQRKSKILKKLKLKPKSYLLLTLHRNFNVDNPNNLRKIIKAVEENGGKIIFPIHPRTKKQLKKLKITKFRNLKLVKPVGYIDMLVLEKNAKKILTDSGGVQKEAYWLKVPCITLRNETEWVETILSGWNVLTGVNKGKIIKAIKNFWPKKKQKDYFGTGNTAKRISQVLIRKFYG